MSTRRASDTYALGVFDGRQFIRLPIGATMPSKSFLMSFSDCFRPAVATRDGVYYCNHEGETISQLIEWKYILAKNRKVSLCQFPKLL